MTKKSIFFRSATLVCAFSITTLLAVGPIGIGSSQAIAASNGNENGNGGNSGGSNGNSHSSNNENAGSHGKSHVSGIASSDDASSGEKGDTGKGADKTLKSSSGKLASKLGALNAAHASANAFAHASPNSRIGKIKEYFLSNEAAKEADTKLADAQAAAATAAKNNTSAQSAVTDAQAALQTAQDALAAATGDPAAAQQAVTDAEAALATAIAKAATTQQAADATAADLAAAQADAAVADAAVQSALNAAANKRPVDDATKAALDALLAGKIAVPLPL